MPLVIAAVAPHGFPIIPEISDDADGAMQTREAMLTMGKRFKEADLDAIFITGPHGIRVNGAISLADVARAAGTLVWKDRQVEMNFPVDLELTDDIYEAAKAKGVPVAGVGYGGSNRNQSVLPADWGVMTPLWFAGHDVNVVGGGYVLAGLLGGVPEEPTGPAAIIANPSRMIPREHNVEFGKAVAGVAQASERRIGFIASCDWAHRHDPGGPNGFHPDAPKMDAEVSEAMKRNDILSLIDLDDDYIHNAAIDGLWQLLMLGGAQQVVPMDVDFLSYEAPSYYGMIVATYAPS
jgi:aromatic ring-opening dioxygenase LigB subunit